PGTGVDIDAARLDPMLAGIANDLGRRIKAHRLAVEQRRGKGGWVMTFEPGRDIDQKREAGGMAFWKTVGAESFDLMEAALGEISRIAACDHALDHLVAEPRDDAEPLERRHGAAKLVGLLGAEAGGNDGDLHRLFLKKRDAQRLLKDLAQRRRGVLDL